MTSIYDINYFKSPKQFETLYDTVSGTIYNPVIGQCDDSPLKTGDGSIIIPHKASSQRWIAISQHMLDHPKAKRILNDSTIDRFRGEIKYGDTIWIDAPNPNIVGWWIVHDSMNKRLKNCIDFLQTEGDHSLNKNKMGLKNIRISKIKYGYYKNHR